VTALHLVGIGTGNPNHLTLEAVAVLKAAERILIPHKGDEKSDLADIRYRICSQVLDGAMDKIVAFDMPVRDPAIADYGQRVDSWHDEIAQRWRTAFGDAGSVALLVWGDPSLYDSTLRIADRLAAQGLVTTIAVVPGITSLQALCAAHTIPINTINGPFTVTTGRRLRDEGWPPGADTVIVMLDGECSFQTLDPAGLWIWWGAYLGMEEEVTLSGRISDVASEILRLRADKRAQMGWIMDTYLIRKTLSDRSHDPLGDQLIPPSAN